MVVVVQTVLMVVMVVRWNWYDSVHDDIGGREEEMVEVEMMVVTGVMVDMAWQW